MLLHRPGFTVKCTTSKKVKEAGIPITINALYQQLTGIKEIVNLYTPAHNHARGRLKAEYVMSSRSLLQEKIKQGFKNRSVQTLLT